MLFGIAMWLIILFAGATLVHWMLYTYKLIFNGDRNEHTD